MIDNIQTATLAGGPARYASATLAGGCFWCTEAVFKRLKGVISVTPGYAGGTKPNPNYEQIHTNTTGHAECIQLEFDPKSISYETLLDVFFATHDPTTINRQGNDEGEEYRSIIFYHDERQKEIAFAVKERLEKEQIYKDPIITEIVPYSTFYEAESEHKNFYEKNQNSPYCRLIIDPKIQKLIKNFGEKVKEEYL